MNELSPIAQAVLDAFGSASDGEYVDGVLVNERTMLAAALRVAVTYTKVHPGDDIWQCDANELLAIATELEAQ